MAFTEELYLKLANEEDARVCTDISDQACRETPRSFSFILISYLLTKLGDAIASPKTTLAWLVSAVGAPAFVLGFLVPIRESGSMIPQLFIGGTIRQLEIRKWVWVIGSIVQGICIGGIGLASIALEGAAAGWALLALITAFSLARGFCSVSAKDVLGKTIPKPQRGNLSGWSASAAGALTVGVGLTLILVDRSALDAVTLGVLVAGAGGLWFIAALTYAQVAEYVGETAGGRSAVDALKKLRILATDAPFRRFVITRALLMCSALSAPFYVALGQKNLDANVSLLGAFIVAGGLASLLSAPLWGRQADQSSKRVMIAAALITSGIGIVTFAVSHLAPQMIATIWFLPLAYFILSIAHSGVRVGRKTYVVNLGTGNDRTDYVAISNTVIGVLLLAVGSIGALASIIGDAGVLGVLAAMGLAGAILGISLPDVEAD